nr:hypothetical protein [Dendronalium sp. ChiSLP03b]MDZ8208812.1 hypothetical protein [Dendronalium sp. ChiSLP03b]
MVGCWDINQNVIVIPDFGGSQHTARAVYHAVNSYKDRLTSVKKFEISPFTEEENSLLKDIKQYIKEHFGSDAMTVKLKFGFFYHVQSANLKL